MIERLYVNNFRCLENFSIDFQGRDSVLIIGRNGSGKSTIGNTLGVFRDDLRGINHVRNLIAGSDFTQQRTNIPMRFEVEATLANRRFKYAISFEMPENFREAHVAERNCRLMGTLCFRAAKDK